MLCTVTTAYAGRQPASAVMTADDAYAVIDRELMCPTPGVVSVRLVSIPEGGATR